MWFDFPKTEAKPEAYPNPVAPCPQTNISKGPPTYWDLSLSESILKTRNSELTMKVARLQDKEKSQQAVIDSQAKMLQELARQIIAPKYLVNERTMEACLEFARTVLNAKDKLMMTRTKP